jgi:hypothetical protein
MAHHGDIKPMPAVAVFADTQAEPMAVYDHLEWLATAIGFPIEKVTGGNLGEDSLKIILPGEDRKSYLRIGIPMFYEENGKQIMMQRRCTTHYKIHPIRRAVRKYFADGVIQWIGISTDEASRMRDSDVAYIENRYPLIELGMSRQDCIEWLVKHKYPVPEKSSCTFCPYHSDAHWLRLQQKYPADFQHAVDYERQVQELSAKVTSKVITPYLHRSKIPLDQVDFANRKQPSLFQDECQGMCGN